MTKKRNLRGLSNVSYAAFNGNVPEGWCKA